MSLAASAAEPRAAVNFDAQRSAARPISTTCRTPAFIAEVTAVMPAAQLAYFAKWAPTGCARFRRTNHPFVAASAFRISSPTRSTAPRSFAMSRAAILSSPVFASNSMRMPISSSVMC